MTWCCHPLQGSNFFLFVVCFSHHCLKEWAGCFASCKCWELLKVVGWFVSSGWCVIKHYSTVSLKHLFVIKSWWESLMYKAILNIYMIWNQVRRDCCYLMGIPSQGTKSRRPFAQKNHLAVFPFFRISSM